uniref:Uncharacterized protein n=1 Tax=Anser brachyrhynchus TaxID=132585 RepID=A0A8B9CS95_9AVES
RHVACLQRSRWSVPNSHISPLQKGSAMYRAAVHNTAQGLGSFFPSSGLMPSPSTYSFFFFLKVGSPTAAWLARHRASVLPKPHCSENRAGSSCQTCTGVYLVLVASASGTAVRRQKRPPGIKP